MSQSILYNHKIRYYEIEFIKQNQELKVTSDNPFVKLNNESLLKNVKKEIVRKAKKKIYDDPLSIGLEEKKIRKNEEIKKEAENINTQSISIQSNNLNNEIQQKIKNENIFLGQSLIYNNNRISDDFNENWELLKKNLLLKFSSDDDQIIKSTFSVAMNEDEIENNYKIDIGRSRLDELEKKYKGEFSFTTTKEYVNKLDSLLIEMNSKWKSNDMVSSIKIMIHCTKILNDISTPKFYCHKFIIITNILETFSNLVYERIFKLSFPNIDIKDYDKGNFEVSPLTITEKAKDICSNWIYKCSCIRELLPRIYIDIIFLKIMKFMKTEKEIEEAIINIARKIAGISHPLISFYISIYFCYVVMSLYPKSKTFIIFLLDLLSKYKINNDLITKFSYENITPDEFIKFIEPTIEWLLYSLSLNASNAVANQIIEIIENTNNSLIVKYFIIHFPTKFTFNSKVIDFLFSNESFSKSASLTLAYTLKMATSDNLLDKKYISIITNNIYSLASTDPNSFLEGAGLISEIYIKFFDDHEQDRLFDNIFQNIRHITSVKMDKEIMKRFEKLMTTIVKKLNNSSGLINIDNFLVFVDTFKIDFRINTTKAIINQILNEDNNKKITDPYLAYVVLKINKYLNDFIFCNKRQISLQKEITSFIEDSMKKLIKNIDFGIDYETYFNFLSEIRGSIFDNNEIIELVLIEVEKICYSTLKILKGKNNKKSLRFIKACIAFIQITIPSIKDIKTQIKHLILASEIAMFNNLISECDSLIKSAITCISEIYEKGLEGKDKYNDYLYINNYLNKLLSFIIVIPSNPDYPYQLISGLINIFSNEDGQINKTYIKYLLKINITYSVIKAISTLLQFRLPYHIKNVDSNDDFLANEVSYQKEGLILIDKSINEIMEGITYLDTKKEEMKGVDLENFSLIAFEISYSLSKFIENNKQVKLIKRKMKELAIEYYHLYEKKKDRSCLKYERIKSLVGENI